MCQLTTTLVSHNAVRLIECCVCDATWEERWIGAALVSKAVAFGPLCPRCIERSPATMADRFRQKARQMNEALVRLESKWQDLPDLEDEELQANVLRLHRKSYFWQSTCVNRLNRHAE